MQNQTQHPTTENTNYDDEIDLFELWEGLVQEKWVILIVTFLFLVLAGVYSIFGAKTYEVKAEILPPLQRDMFQLHYPGITEITPNLIYQSFTERLTGNDLIQKLLLQPEVAKSLIKEHQGYNEAFEVIQQKISINLPEVSEAKLRVSEPLLTELSFQNDQPESTYLFVEQLLALAAEETKQQILDENLAAIESILVNNQQNYLLEDQRMTNEKLSELKRLEDEFYKAETLGIETPVNPIQYEKSSNATTKLELSTQNPVGYWLGTKILQTNINVLKNRKDNLPYSQKLRELVNEKRKLESALVRLKSADFKVYRFASKPYIPETPIKPKKALILAVAGVLGLMLGVFVALIRRAVKKRAKAQLTAA